MNIPINVLALVFVLSVLIVVHEFGHYAVAKGFRFPVEIFSLGFGKRLFGWKRKETDYRVSLIPLGGYVKVTGLGPDESDVVAGQEPSTPLGPRWQRLLVLVAGPGMNFVLALLLTAAAFVIGMEVLKYQDEAPVVKHVEARSPAERSGVKVDDLVVAIGGKRVSTWREVEMDLGLAPREDIPVELKRGSETVHVTLRPEPDKKYDIGYTGLNPYLAPVVGALLKNYPAEKAGLKAGDRIVSVGGNEVTGYYEVVRRIREAATAGAGTGPRPIEFVVERAGERLRIPITPREEAGSWRIGFAPRYETVTKRLGLFEAFGAAGRELVRQTQTTGVTVARLFRGTSSMRQLSGPIDIAKFSGEAARSGPAALVGLMGILSLQLGLLNLLPIPLLDGGQIFVTLLEAVVRRDFPVKLKERLLQAGFVFLVLLMVTVLYFDVLKNVSF
jgi:regulator of sigma E protease